MWDNFHHDVIKKGLKECSQKIVSSNLNNSFKLEVSKHLNFVYNFQILKEFHSPKINSIEYLKLKENKNQQKEDKENAIINRDEGNNI